MFPPGLPGLGLLILRVSVAIALLLEQYGHRPGLPHWVLAVVILLSLTLCLGFLTPLAAVLGLVFHGLNWYTLGAQSASMAAIVFVDAVALALLGPGGYSIDSLLFGRRIVILPPS
jgi:hypothetical protein